jgi:hypothetical protein
MALHWTIGLVILPIAMLVIWQLNTDESGIDQRLVATDLGHPNHRTNASDQRLVHTTESATEHDPTTDLGHPNQRTNASDQAFVSNTTESGTQDSPSTCFGLQGFQQQLALEEKGHGKGKFCCYRCKHRTVMEHRDTVFWRRSHPPNISYDWPLNVTKLVLLPLTSDCYMEVTRVQSRAFQVKLVGNCSCVSANTTRHNRCCNLFPRNADVEDANGVPLCGRFFHSHVTLDAGLGHALAEYNTNLLAHATFGLKIVRGTLPRLGHAINRDDVLQSFGIESHLKYTVDDVAKAVQLGYLENITVTDLAATAAGGFEDAKNDVLFWSTTQNRGNRYDITASLLQVGGHA